MNKRISHLVAGGFALLIGLGLCASLFLLLNVQQTLEEFQNIEATALESRAATRNLRADYWEMGGAVSTALLNPALFHQIRGQKRKSDDSADKHLQIASKLTRRADLKRLLGQLKAHDANVTDPLKCQVVKLAQTNLPAATRLYNTKYLPAQTENIRLSQAALDLSERELLDLNTKIKRRTAQVQSLARLAILLFVLVGALSAFWLTRAVAGIARQSAEAARVNQNMMEYSQDVICSIDQAGRFIEVSPACRKVWGYSPEELKGQPYIEFVHPDDVAKTNQAAGSIVAGQATADFENRYLRQDGSAVNMLWSANWSKVEKSMFCVARDISERKRTETELRANEERTRLIVDTAYDAYIAIDAAHLIIDWNRQAEAVFGWSRAAAMEQPIYEMIIPPPYRAAHQQGLQHFLATGEGPVLNKPIEIAGLHRDGHEFPVELTISPVRWGETYVFSAFIRDISERKRAETALIQAKEDAEAGSRAKSDFLANMSHEIRTPMNGVLGTINLLLDTQLTPTQRELAGLANASADTLLTIINDILDFSKIEAGMLSIEPIPFDLLLSAEEVGGMMAARAEEKGLDLILRYAPDTPRHLVGDPGRIRQVLTNLISNALKFTSQGQVLVNIEAEAQTATQAELRITIQDSGIGIATDKLEQLFEKFTQADASTTRKYGGTGLGLAISKQLVELMGGTIGATSQPGEGSTFWFTLRLPLQTGEPEQIRDTVDVVGVRVLIVDDNAVNRHVLHEQMLSWKLRSASCASGDEALAALRAAHAAGDPYQIAILDYQMPDMDGEMLGRAIKADPLIGKTVLVMLTSLGQRGDAPHLKEVGFAAYLVKPARQSELLATLTSVWASHSQGVTSELVTRHTLAESHAAKNARTEVAPIQAHVLLAEDNLVNQKIASAMLQNLGCQVDIANNGREATEMLETVPYAMIFMDCEMPEMDGFEATAVIRGRRDAKRDIPIIAVTAKAIQGDRERCLAAGMNDYITKPVQTADFRAALVRWGSAGDEGRGMRDNGGAADGLIPAPPAAVAHPVAPAAPDEAQAASHAPQVPVLDAEVVAQLRSLAAATDASLLTQIVDSFLGDTTTRLSALRQATAAGDAVTLRQAAHTLKGASASIGARGMAATTQQLEALGEAQTMEGAAALIEQLEQEFDRVKVELAAQLPTPV